MDYHSKYLKYKQKYINLKNIQKGGEFRVDSLRHGLVGNIENLIRDPNFVNTKIPNDFPGEEKDIRTPLFFAIEFYEIYKDNDYLEIIKLLLKKADVNEFNEKGIPPLIYVIKCFEKYKDKDINKNDNYLEIIKLLIEAGADVNKKDKKGFPPLVYALNKGYEKLMLKHHNPDHKSKEFDIILNACKIHLN